MHDSYKKWLDDGCPKIICACGCGQEIIVKRYRKYRGIPKYISGHAGRINPIPESYQKWLDNKCPKVYCTCGCGKEITIKPHHKYQGIPKFIRSHIYRILVPRNKPLYPIIFDLCKCGCNEIVWGRTQFKPGHHMRIMINPMKRPEIVVKFMGENNSSKRPEVKKNISEGLKNSKKHKDAMSSPQFKEKNRIAHLGKKLPEEQKIKIGIGVKNSEKYQEAIRNRDWSGEKSPSWQGGISYLPYCPKFNEEKKEEVRNQYNRKCYLCGKDEKDNITKTGKIRKLSVHHVDNDKQQGCDGKKWKLVPLCQTCHNSKKMESLNE